MATVSGSRLAHVFPVPGNSSDALPSISVLMDVTNGERFLDEALASLAVQTFTDFEIVLCAHGATERTASIIEEWRVREPRLRVLWKERLPLSKAHNLAARAARAPLLARLDADDVAAPDRLERQYAMFQRQPQLSFAGGAVEFMDARGRTLFQTSHPLSDEAIREALVTGCPFAHSTLMIRAEAFWSVDGYREGLNLAEDWDLYTRLTPNHLAINCAEVLGRYRVHPASLTSSSPMRLAIASLTVGAAAAARRAGEPEPFVRGVPCLRSTQRLLGLSRSEMRRSISGTALRITVGRQVMTSPLPRSFKIGAFARRLRPLYRSLFRFVPHLSRSFPSASNGLLGSRSEGDLQHGEETERRAYDREEVEHHDPE